jgi:hypothetical protein
MNSVLGGSEHKGGGLQFRPYLDLKVVPRNNNYGLYFQRSFAEGHHVVHRQRTYLEESVCVEQKQKRRAVGWSGRCRFGKKVGSINPMVCTPVFPAWRVDTTTRNVPGACDPEIRQTSGSFHTATGTFYDDALSTNDSMFASENS